MEEKGFYNMLKVVIFDSGYGGELFADQLEAELPVLDVIRVIDWRNAEKIQSSPRDARTFAKRALAPYIGRVDLIIFANYLLSVTSLKHFKRKYKNQRFLGLALKHPDSFVKRETLVLTTKPVARTLGFQNFLIRTGRKTKTITLDSWTAKIDDGELTPEEIHSTLTLFSDKKSKSKEIVLACAQFNDIKNDLRNLFGKNLKIYDGFSDAIISTSKLLKIRGGSPKKKR